jgi:hypothetical protein
MSAYECVFGCDLKMCRRREGKAELARENFAEQKSDLAVADVV